MARPTIFITGVTGFVGGTILTTLQEAHPEIQIKALVRREQDGKKIEDAYRNVTAIIGDLSSLDLLTSTVAQSDFVIHAGGDNIPAVCAMIDGLASSHTNSTTPVQTTTPSPKPRLLTLTGPRSLIDLSKPITGTLDPTSKPWSDVHDIDRILNSSVPTTDRMHAAFDQAVIAHSAAKKVGTMLVSPGQLWGRGKGLFKRESNSAMYYQLVKERGRAFIIGDGGATWSWTSVGDLGRAVVRLVEISLAIDLGRDRDEEQQQKRSPVGVNREGYYFVSTGDLSMMERATAITQRLGLGEEVESVSVEAAKQMHPFGHVMWGCGERTRAHRLAALGWAPEDTDWMVLMQEDGGERA